MSVEHELGEIRRRLARAGDEVRRRTDGLDLLMRALEAGARVHGIHRGCGGPVVYQVGDGWGIEKCLACGAASAWGEKRLRWEDVDRWDD